MHMVCTIGYRYRGTLLIVHLIRCTIISSRTQRGVSETEAAIRRSLTRSFLGLGLPSCADSLELTRGKSLHR